MMARLSILVFLTPALLFAWGHDGHQDICHEALNLLNEADGSNPAVQCLMTNIDFFSTAGSSPDEHFKMGISEYGLLSRLQRLRTLQKKTNLTGRTGGTPAPSEYPSQFEGPATGQPNLSSL